MEGHHWLLGRYIGDKIWNIKLLYMRHRKMAKTVVWSFNRRSKKKREPHFWMTLGKTGSWRKGRGVEGDKWRWQSPLSLPLDLGSESADRGLSHLSFIQSTIRSWPIGFPCCSLLLGVKWSAGTLLILICLSIRPHNESVCQSDWFRRCRFPENPPPLIEAGNCTMGHKLDVGFHNSSDTSW